MVEHLSQFSNQEIAVKWDPFTMEKPSWKPSSKQNVIFVPETNQTPIWSQKSAKNVIFRPPETYIYLA